MPQRCCLLYFFFFFNFVLCFVFGLTNVPRLSLVLLSHACRSLLNSPRSPRSRDVGEHRFRKQATTGRPAGGTLSPDSLRAPRSPLGFALGIPSVAESDVTEVRETSSAGLSLDGSGRRRNRDANCFSLNSYGTNPAIRLRLRWFSFQPVGRRAVTVASDTLLYKS